MLGSLEVAAHPVEAVGYPRQHSRVAPERAHKIIARWPHEPAPEVASELAPPAPFNPFTAMSEAFKLWSSPFPGRRTQVSLLPPPCEEFTTREPLRSATRVRPPGTSVTFSPIKM